MANALFAAATQAPSTSAAITTPSAGASWTVSAPASVTRPLAFMAASPQSRCGLEMYLSGGCVLPPLGSLVLQVQPHQLSQASGPHPSRAGARRASRRRITCPEGVVASHRHEETASDASHSLLLVCSTNVAITTLPFQPLRTSSSSSVTQPQATAMATLANLAACRTPARPASAVTPGGGDGARTLSSFSATSPPHHRLLPSLSAALQSCRIPVAPAVPRAASAGTSPASVVQTRTALLSAAPSSVKAVSPASTAAGAKINAVLVSSVREAPATLTSIPTGSPPLLRPLRPTPPALSPPTASRAPSSIPTALQTLCHALWWVHRRQLPVSLSFLRYSEEDIQALWAALSGSFQSFPPQQQQQQQAAAAAAATDESTGKPAPSPMHERHGKRERTCGELDGKTPPLVTESDGVQSVCRSAGDCGFRVSEDELRCGLVTGGSGAAVVVASADGAADIVPSSGTPGAPSAPPILTLRSSVTQLHVHGKAADAAVLALLPAHPEVRSLRLTHGSLSDAQLRHLTRVCPDVTHLSLAMNSRIETTAFLCPPLSDTSSVATSATTANTAVTAQPETVMGSPDNDGVYQLTCLHQPGSRSKATATATHMEAPTLPLPFSSSASAACAAADDATHTRLSTLPPGEAAASDTVDALGPCSEAGRGTDASSVQSTFHLPHSRLLPHQSSQLDLFSPDEEGELEMRMSLWQAAQTDTAERRQLVFVLRPQDVVLGTHECAASNASGISGAETTDSGRGAASTTTEGRFLSGLPADAISLSAPSCRRPSPQTRASATRVTLVGPKPAPAARKVLSESSLPTNGTSSPVPARGYADSRPSLAPRLIHSLCPELVTSLQQPPASPPSTRVTAATSPSALSTSNSHTTTVTRGQAGDGGPSTVMRSDRRRFFHAGPPPPVLFGPLASSSSDRVNVPASRLHRHRSRSRSQECHRRRKGHGCLSSPPRSTYWADTLVDLDLSYTQVSDDDVARDVPQLRRLHRLSLEGCVRLSQIAWLPLLPHLHELNLSLCSVQGHALYPLGRCPRLAWLKLEGCPSFTAAHQLWCKEADSAHMEAGGDGGGATAAAASVSASAFPVVHHTTIGGIPAFTVLPPLTGRMRTPTTRAAPTAVPASTGPFTTSVRAATAAGGAAEAGGHGRSGAVAADAVDEAIAAGGAEPAPLLSGLRVLIATSTGLTDAGLRFLDRMAALDCLVLDRCPGVTNVSVAAMLPSLRTLDVSRTRVGPEGLAGLRLSRTLQQLRLQECSELSRLPTLLVEPSSLRPATAGGAAGDESFGLRPSMSTVASVSHRPARNYPLLTVLDLSYTKQLTADGLAGLVADEATVAMQAAAAALTEHLAGRRRNGGGGGDVVAEGVSLTLAPDEALPPAAIFPHLRHVLLRSCDAVTHLHPLRGFTNVVELDLYHTNVTDATLTAALASWTCLEVLDIASTRVRSLAAWCPCDPSETLATAAATTRQGEDGVTTEGHHGLHPPQRPLQWHGRLPAFAATLRVLVLSNTEVTAEGLAALAFFPQLEVLQMSNCRQLSSLRFLALKGDGTPRRLALGELTVTEATHLTNADAFPYIACCPALRVLSLAGCVQLGSGAAAPVERGAPYRRLSCHTDQNLSVLGRLRGLAELNLSNTGVDLRDLRMILCASTSSSSRASDGVQNHHLYQRMWLRGCRHLDEGALMSAAAEALRQSGDPPGGGDFMACRQLPLLREVYLSHGKYGAAVLSGLLS
ncbi:hypothetical protein JKF63_07124 [Porcisia hertigi]|uniref:Uncharacterized protein n=1 Tax=Porcisia hertigi TaxID=2761500 RepID=A0A836LKD9_9TRYP|nr:hypothetical protein JKF63_07124 [Porcisia hertigi]